MGRILYSPNRVKVHPEAGFAFEAEIGCEKEEEQHRREILEKYKYSPYIEEIEE